MQGIWDTLNLVYTRLQPNCTCGTSTTFGTCGVLMWTVPLEALSSFFTFKIWKYTSPFPIVITTNKWQFSFLSLHSDSKEQKTLVVLSNNNHLFPLLRKNASSVRLITPINRKYWCLSGGVLSILHHPFKTYTYQYRQSIYAQSLWVLDTALKYNEQIFLQAILREGLRRTQNMSQRAPERCINTFYSQELLFCIISIPVFRAIPN